MKVVHFLHGRANPEGTNGGDRVIYNLARCSADLGAQVFVLGLSGKSPLPIGRAVVKTFAVPPDPFSLPSTLTQTLLAIQPDVVHFHGVYTPRSARLAGWLRSRSIPYAISPHGGLMREVLSRNRIRKAAYLAFLGRRFCREASLIHCVSEAEAEAIRPFNQHVPAVVAPHGLEGRTLQSLDPGVLHREFPALRGKRIFGFLGRLDPAHKGLDLVVEACAQIRSSLSNAVVILAGPDWKNRTWVLRRRVVELGLEKMVLFVGPKMAQDKFNFLVACDAFIHPSRWEAGVPFSVLDALELAKPCLVSDGGFFGTFFQQHAAGLQVPLTTEGVAEGLNTMATASDDYLRAMGNIGTDAVRQEFSWERSARKLLQAYEGQLDSQLARRTAGLPGGAPDAA